MRISPDSTILSGTLVRLNRIQENSYDQKVGKRSYVYMLWTRTDSVLIKEPEEYEIKM